MQTSSSPGTRRLALTLLALILPVATAAQPPADVRDLTTTLARQQAAWLAAAPEARDAAETALAATARARARALGRLVAADPAAVLAAALPSDAAGALPERVRGLVESHVDLAGTLEVFAEDRTDGHRLHHVLVTAAGRRPLHLAGAAPGLASGTRVRVRGVAVGDALAVDASSGLTVTAAALAAASGEQRTLVLLVNFSDKVQQPYTVDHARAVVFDTTSDFDLEGSYGRTWLTGDVHGWFTIPLSSTVCDTAKIASQAKQAAAAAGVSLSGYTRFVYGFPDNACTWWGYGMIGGSVTDAWVKGTFSLRVVGHEMGHNLGLYHAQSLDCGAAPIGGSCTASAYGDTVDIMGASSGHFNAFQKDRLGWIGAAGQPPVATVTSSGSYWIDPYETDGGTTKALKIQKSLEAGGKRTWYYVELRRGLGFDAAMRGNTNLMNGVVLHTGSETTGNSSYLLDMTPETSSFSDAALVVGRTFSDPAADVSITPLAVSDTGGWVSVSFGGAPCTPAAPTVAVTPLATPWAAAGTPVAYTATVTNRDGASCPSTTFEVRALAPPGWSGTTAAVTVAPGAGAPATISVTAPAGTPEGLYSFTIQAVDPGAPSREASAGASQMIVASLDVTATPGQISYKVNQTASVEATVSLGSAPAAGVPVTFRLTKPNGATSTGSATTDAAGRAGWSVRVRKNDPKGTWRVETAAQAGALRGTAATSFVVQ